MSLKLTRYRVRYRDGDPSCPVFSWCCRAYDRGHALELFRQEPGWEEPGDAEILSVRRDGR